MDIDAQESLGDKIKRLRSEKGMTQKELADDFVTVSMISQLERGVKQASVELLQHIAKKLQVPLRELADTEVEQMERAWQHQLAKAYLAAKQPDDAEPLLVELRGRSDLSQAVSIELDVDYAECRYQQGKYEETLGLLLPLNEQLIESDYDDAHVRALVQFMIGNCYFKGQNFITANFYYRSAYDLTLRFPVFDQLAAKVAFKTGETLRYMGNDHEAIFYLNRSYEFFKNNNNLYRLAATMLAQGIIYKNRQEYSQAFSNLSDASGLFRGLNLTLESYDVQVTIAASITVKQDPILALKQLEECIGAYGVVESYTDMVLVYSKMSLIQLDVGDFEGAFSNLSRAKLLMDKFLLHHSSAAAVLYQVLAKYHFMKQSFDKAIEYSLKSSSIFDKIGFVADQVESLQIACDAYHEIGDDSQAFLLERTCNNLLKKLNWRRTDIQ